MEAELSRDALPCVRFSALPERVPETWTCQPRWMSPRVTPI